MCVCVCVCVSFPILTSSLSLTHCSSSNFAKREMSSIRLPLFRRLAMIRRLSPFQYTANHGLNYIAKCTIRSFITGGTEDEYEHGDEIYEMLSLLHTTALSNKLETFPFSFTSSSSISCFSSSSLSPSISCSSSSASSSSASSSSVSSLYANPPRDILSLVFQYTDRKTMIYAAYQVNRYWQSLVDTPCSWSKLCFSGDAGDLIYTCTIIPRVIPSLRDVTLVIVDSRRPPLVGVCSKARTTLIDLFTRVSKLQRLVYYQAASMFLDTMWPLNYLRHCKDTLQEYVCKYGEGHASDAIGSFDGYDHLVKVQLHNTSYSLPVQLPASVQSLVLNQCRNKLPDFSLLLYRCHLGLTNLTIHGHGLVLDRRIIFPSLTRFNSLYTHHHLLSRVNHTKIRSLTLSSSYKGDYTFPNLEELDFDSSDASGPQNMSTLTSSRTLKRLHLIIPHSIKVDQLMRTCNLSTIDTLILSELKTPPSDLMTLLKLSEERSSYDTLYFIDAPKRVCIIYYMDIPNIRGGLLWRRFFTKLATSSAKTINVDTTTLAWMTHSLSQSF